MIVETRTGKLRGLAGPEGLAFLGIPYAAPPLPPHRFMAPRPAAPWAGVRAAAGFADQAAQLLFAFLDPALADDPAQDANRAFHAGVADPVTPYGENCLALNVWTPALAGARPVMVWLHGGGFASGSGSWGVWTGETLAAEQDVVVVNLNHRLNIFGYLSLQDHGGADHGTVPNAGMLDIVMALEWVRDNIAAFGGDPGNVTIFGQSGGGMKVGTLMAMPAAKGLFHKAIMQSGPPLLAIPRERAAAVAARALAHLGCDVAGLQSVPAAALLAAFAAAGEGGPGVPRQFGPVVDGESLPRHPFAPDAPALAASVPVLIGATGQEITSLQGFRDPSIFTIAADALVARVAGFCAIPDDAAQALVAAYRAARPERTPAQIYAAIASDRQFGFGAIVLAERQATQAPVFAYRLEWQSPAAGGRYGAPHNLDLPLIFGRDRAPGVTGAGTAHHPLAAAMQMAWGNFARTGNPNHRGLPHWPVFDAGQRATMIFDADCQVVDDPHRAERLAQAVLPPRA